MDLEKDKFMRFIVINIFYTNMNTIRNIPHKYLTEIFYISNATK